MLQQIAETASVAMLALLSLLDLFYMFRSTLAATLLKIIALPVPLLRQVSVQGLKMMKNHSVFEVFRCLGLSRSVLGLCTLS